MNHVVNTLMRTFYCMGIVVTMSQCTTEADETKSYFTKSALENTLMPYSAFFDVTVDELYDEIQEIYPIVITKAKQYHQPPEFVFAIVAPELFRYSAMKDFLETKALELMYVQHGKEQADFSIGIFQMKPSFAEKIEQEFKDQFTENTPLTLSRKLRIERLKSIPEQVKYACLFCQSMDKKYAHEKWDSPEDKVMFYATAYNLGLAASKEKILQWKDLKIFPFGEKYGTDQCAYGAIARDMYLMLNR